MEENALTHACDCSVSGPIHTLIIAILSCRARAMRTRWRGGPAGASMAQVTAASKKPIIFVSLTLLLPAICMCGGWSKKKRWEGGEGGLVRLLLSLFCLFHIPHKRREVETKGEGKGIKDPNERLRESNISPFLPPSLPLFEHRTFLSSSKYFIAES